MTYFVIFLYMKKLLSLVVGYAAGLAVAMKYRKDAGTSKLDTNAEKGKLDAFIDEVVDIHKTVYSDIKAKVTETFDDVHDFEGLKTKVTGLIDSLQTELEEKFGTISSLGEEKKEEALSTLDALYTKREEALTKAKAKAETFTDEAHETALSWLGTAREKLESLYTSTKEKLHTISSK